MAFKRPKAAVPAAQLKVMQDQIKKQEISKSAPRTTDPNFPVFRLEPGVSKFVYVPNQVTQDEEGNLVHLRDEPLYHTIHPTEREFHKIRCVKGIVNESIGFTGECPLCDAVQDGFTLAGLKRDSACAAAGVDPTAKDNEIVKNFNRKFFGNREIDNSQRSYTFPIAVIERTKNAAGKTVIAVDDSGKPVFNLYWYTISDRHYENVWGSAFEGVDEDEVPSSIAGQFFNLSAGKKDANGNAPSAMEAAKDSHAIVRAAKPEIAKIIDEAAAEWTPEKAQEVIIANQFLLPADLEEAIAPIVQDMEAQIQVYESAKANGTAVNSGGPTLEALTGGKSADSEPSIGLIDASEVDGFDDGDTTEAGQDSASTPVDGGKSVLDDDDEDDE